MGRAERPARRAALVPEQDPSSSTKPARRRVDDPGDTVRLDLADCFVDAIEVAARGPAGHRDARRRAAAAAWRTLFAGDFLEGLEIDRSPVFNGWLTAQRRRFRGCHAALLEHLAGSVPDDEAFGYLEQWLELAPFDRRAARAPADRARAPRPDPRGRGASGGDRSAVRSRGPRLRPLRDAWRSARAQDDERAAASHAASALRTTATASRDDIATAACPPRLDRRDAVRRSVHRERCRAAAPPMRSPTT